MNKFQVNVGGVASLQHLVLDHAEKIGYRSISDRDYIISTFHGYYQFNYFGDNAVTHSRSIFAEGSLPEISIAEFLKMEKQKSVTLRLNSRYDAVITANVISVGCQEFSFKKLDELVEAVKAFRS